MAKRKPNQEPEDFDDDMDTPLSHASPTDDEAIPPEDGEDERDVLIRELRAENERLKSQPALAVANLQWYRVKHKHSPAGLTQATSAAEAIAKYYKWAGIIQTDIPAECGVHAEPTASDLEKLKTF